MSGDGGDELFCGYNRYNSTNNWSNKLNLIPMSLRKVLASGIKSISQDNLNRILNLLPNLNDYASEGYKIKSINALEAKTLSDLYYVLLSQWQNPQMQLQKVKNQNFFNKISTKTFKFK